MRVAVRWSGTLGLGSGRLKGMTSRWFIKIRTEMYLLFGPDSSLMLLWAQTSS